MKLHLKGCSNSGFSLTEPRKKQILELASWIENNKTDNNLTYKSMQDCIEADDTNILDGSKIRMLVPFMRKMGYIYDDDFNKRNSNINLQNFFTTEGLLFIESIKLEHDINDLKNIEIKNIMDEIKELFEINCIVTLIEKDERIYKDTLKFLKKYNSMNKNEFFIMTTLIDICSDNKLEAKLDKAIKKYREGAFKNRIVIDKHVNSFNYVKSLLQECSLIQENNSHIYINKKYEKIIEQLV